MRTPEQCAQDQLDAYNARDIDRFADVYADGIQLIDLRSGVAFCDGVDALRERYGPMFAAHPDLHCHLVRRIVCGVVVFDEEQVHGLRPDGPVHATAIYETDAGRITRAWFVREE